MDSETETENDLNTGYTRRLQQTKLANGAATPKDKVSRTSVRKGASMRYDDLGDTKDQVPAPKRRKLRQDEVVRETWSDDEDAQVVAKRTHQDMTEKERKAPESKSNAKPRSAAKTSRGSGVRGDGVQGTGVGVRKKKKTMKARQPHFDDLDSEDEESLDHNIPGYVNDRRAAFVERTNLLKEGGLMLPPSYDDVDFSDDDRLRHLSERPEFPRLKSQAIYKDIEMPYSLGVIPAPIARYLREYQVKGAEFLHELFVYQKGGILGDDMGLGKTIQVIAFLTAAYGKTGDERDQKRMRKMRRRNLWYPKTLVVCPGSLMANWQDELRRWGWWHTEVYHGGGRQKQDVLALAQNGMLEVMITTYTTYRTNKSAINTVSWDCVIADECHIIKERRSEITKSMNEINSLCRIGLSGTAIQNNYEELWTLLNWTSPGRFGTVSTWKSTISEPLKLGQSHNATVYELARARKTAKKLVNNLLPQFFLRRMKTLIKDQLPKKTDRVVFCPLTPTQTEAYQTFLESEVVQTIKNSSNMCDCGSGKKSGWCCRGCIENGDAWQAWVFPAIAYLQRLANHLALLIPLGTDPPDKQAKDLDLLQTAVPDQWKQLYNTRDSIINYSNPEFCGKWRVLRKLLKFWYDQRENKVLVFSHSVRLLKMLQALFISTSYNVKYLDGSMSYDERYTAVQDFNTDPTQFVFLISTRAGGIGLNITSANKVVVVDPNWNPSYDLQAQDRAYRIGQTRDVEVFRLISQGTLEEIVYARQIYKQQQANIGYNATSERRYFSGIQDRRDQKGEIFGLDNLFSFRDENVVLRDIVHKTNVAESRADVRVTSFQVDDDDESHNHTDDHNNRDDRSGDNTDSRNHNAAGEDSAMSQLVAEITGDSLMSRPRRRTKNNNGNGVSTSKRSMLPPTVSSGTATKRHDPIQAILSSVGVSYTHDNSEVIGSSRVETELSRRAEEGLLVPPRLANNRRSPRHGERNRHNHGEGGGKNEGDKSNPLHQQERVFVTESQQVEDEQDVGRGAGGSAAYGPGDDDGQRLEGGAIKYVYRPPPDVQRRQFCTMAKWAEHGLGLGFGRSEEEERKRDDLESVVEFALVVESWTPAQRRECLENFYRWRKDVLDDHIGDGDGDGNDDDEAGGGDGGSNAYVEPNRTGEPNELTDHTGSRADGGRAENEEQRMEVKGVKYDDEEEDEDDEDDEDDEL